MTKLSINGKVRATLDRAPLIEITDRQINEADWRRPSRDRVLLLHDGLIYTHCFPSYYGAFFVLNYERYLEGLLDDEQLDRFVSILLDQIEIPYLKAVHPEADIEGVFTDLLSDRRHKSRESGLLDRINRYGRLPSWSRASKRRSSHFAIMELVLRSAPISIALGHSPVDVLKQLQQELGKAIEEHGVHPALKRPMLDRHLDHFLIGYPELWPTTSVNATRFLGEPMVGRFSDCECYADKPVINGSAGMPLVRRGGDINTQELAGFILTYLYSLDPTVLDAEHLIRDGSRSKAWLDRCSNLEDGLGVLSMLCHCGVTHPALKRIKHVATKLSDDGQKGVVRQYLEQGSRLTEKLTQTIFQAKPELYEWAFEQRKGYASVARLAKIKGLTSEQLGRLEPGIKRRLLEDDMGI